MKRVLLIICLIGILPVVAMAQFSQRIHNLKGQPNVTQPPQKIVTQLSKTVHTDTLFEIKIPDSLFQNALQQINIEHFNEPFDTNGFIHSLTTQFSSYVDSAVKVAMKKNGKDTVTITIYPTLSTGDSMILEYRKLVGAKFNDYIGPQKAKVYREYIDTCIILRYNLQKAQYDSLNNKKGSLFSTIPLFHPDSIQNHLLKYVVVDSINNIVEPQAKLLAQARNYFHYLFRSEDNPISKPWWFPLRSITHAEFFYFGENGERIKLLTNFGVQSTFTNNVNITSEILSGIIPIEAGGKKNPRCRFSLPLKFNLGMTISKEAADTINAERKDISSLMYGGLLHASLSYPIFYSNWKYHNGKGIRTYIPITTTFNWDSKLGDDKEFNQLYYFGELATNVYIEIDLIQGTNAKADAAIFLNTKLAYLDGSSTFYDNHLNKRHGVWLSQFNAGIRVKDRYSIAVNLPIWASQEDILIGRKSPSIAILIDPNF